MIEGKLTRIVYEIGLYEKNSRGRPRRYKKSVAKIGKGGKPKSGQFATLDRIMIK